ncbi:MAG: hypothetical protein JOZ41_12630 [Chloroflexi bacterium]|nr:hypothetical protein [Chloroflexota bacterium]
MNDRDLAALCTQIEHFLRGRASDPAAPDRSLERSRAFWNARPYLTAAELGVLAELVAGPSPAELLACRLGRDLADTQDFLDALVAIGVLERGGDCYAATPATRLYLKAFVDG